ncbi:hypothetical protein STRIP9103_05393 [Streptomyces ipomoeae 91-03]|uniref:Uncharacterized protein n=1 Tax=Streptomyces ipomoeae 91-03 TaxID=698759 RepID=L1L634_9ACTN|nr:hypothetical protein STRIP9103_05393 [Streptomyces ipomoeae 91-03]
MATGDGTSVRVRQWCAGRPSRPTSPLIRRPGRGCSSGREVGGSRVFGSRVFVMESIFM